MAEFQRIPNRFQCAGISLNAPSDITPANKFPILKNLRSYEEGTLQPRTGTARVALLPGAVHSIFRLNDATPFDGGIAATRVYGTGSDLYAGLPGVNPALIDSGYSGNPLSAVALEPVGTVQPYLYVVDSSRMRKLNVNGAVLPIGIQAPLGPPTTLLGAPGLRVLENFDNYTTLIPWISYGDANTPGLLVRVNTTISQIFYDAGTVGNCLISVADFTNVTQGMVLLIGSEDVLVQDVKVAIQPTTIAAIQYDSGTTGPCAIQPAGGLGTGVITSLQSVTQFNIVQAQSILQGIASAASNEGISGDALQSILQGNLYAMRQDPDFYTTANTIVSFSDQDFPAGCLIQIGSELVKIQNVETGRDGVQSFRCTTTGTHTVGEPITGLVAIRANTTVAHAIGNPVVCNVIQNTVSAAPINADGTFESSVGGVQSGPIQSGVTVGSPATGVTPAALAIPDHTDVVTAAKAQAIAAGYDLTTPCGIAQICILVAQQLQAEGAGLFRHFAGMVCSNTQFGSIEADALMYPSGQIVYILANPTGRDGPAPINIPEWSIQPPDGDAAQRWVAVGPTTSPLPPLTPGPQLPPAPPPTGGVVLDFNLGTINGVQLQPDDRLHVSLHFDANVSEIIKVQVLFDVDATQNDFTRNYYLYEAANNNLVAAVQAQPGTITSPTVTQQQAVGVPRGAVQGQTTTALPLGANQWVELTWKLRDMSRIGTDASRSFANVAAIAVLVTIDGSLGNIQCGYGSFYLEGGSNPDTGPDGAPAHYLFRFRSKKTGAISNPGPPTRAESLTPLRQQVTLSTAEGFPDAQADTYDWFRFGGSLTQETYVGSSDTGTFVDNYADDAIVGGETLRHDRFQPWPTTDLPRKGVCNVAGSSVLWISGDAFNPAWAPNAQILLNGIPYTLYASPASATQLQIIESAGALSNATFEIPSPLLPGTPLPTMWGPAQGFCFACGDPNNPGALYWNNGNDFDSASDANFLQVCSGSEVLVNGFVWDGVPFVFSSDELYRIVSTGNDQIPWFIQKLPCGRGLWATWMFCLTPQGVVFGAKDGLFITANGSAAQSITDADLYRLFPHDGAGPNSPINGVPAPDFSQPPNLRLAYVDGFVYFDYAALGTVSP